MDLNLSGKVAVVTGASKGIGLAITRSLAAEGVQVVAGALKGSSELDVLADQRHVFPVLIDLSTPEGPAALIAEAIARLGIIDIVVNNVGALHPRLGGFLDVGDEDWDWAMTINFYAAARTMRAAIPHLIGRSAASIVTISSVNAFLPDPSVIDYSAAKAALTNLCKSLSKEYGSRIRVNTISPGPVQTDLWLGDSGVAATVALAHGTTAQAVADQAVRDTATGRFTYPQEIADLTLFLASDRAANITGANFTIDGGLISTT